MVKKHVLALICIFCGLHIFAQITVNVNSNASQLARVIMGPGVTISNASFIGNSGAVGTFSGPNNMGIDSGILLTSGLAQTAEGPNDTTVSFSWFTAGDQDLANLISDSLYNLWDAAGIQFDMKYTGQCIAFNYTFASEEYPDWPCTPYNDVFGIFISGPGITGNQNIAVIPGTNLPLAVNNINAGPGYGAAVFPAPCPVNTYPQYFINNGTTDPGLAGVDVYSPPNSTSPFYIQYNGFTSVFTATPPTLQVGQTYHVKLVISDDGDTVLDSGAFIRAWTPGSSGAQAFIPGVPYTTGSPTGNIAIAGCSNGIIPIKLNQPDTGTTIVHYQISGTAVNGTDYTSITDSIKFIPGDTLKNVVIQPIISGHGATETVILTFSLACGSSVSDTLYIADSLSVVVNPHDTTICAGASVRLLATGATNYAWTPAAGLSDTAIANPVATPVVSTTYRCTTRSGSCIASDTAHVTVNHALPITVSPHDTTICPGQAVNLVASGATNYTWSPATGLSNTAIANPVANAALTTVYLCTAISGGCPSTDTARINVTTSFLHVTPHDTSICVGAVVNLLATGGANYAWAPGMGLSDSVIANPVANPVLTTTYRCTSAVGNCVSSDTARIEVDYPVPVIVSPHDTTVCPGQSVNLTASSETNYAWTPGMGLSDSAIANPVASPGSSTVYLCTSKAGSCTSTDTARINIKPVFITVAPHDTGICLGDTISLAASGATAYTWVPATGLSSTTAANPVAIPLVTTTYRCSATVGGCLVFDTTHIIVNDPVKVIVSPHDTTICEGDTVDLSATGGNNYVWFPVTGISVDSLGNPVATTSLTTTYTCTLAINNCSFPDTARINILPNYSVMIIPNDTGICPGHEVIVLNAGNYKIYKWQDGSTSQSLSVTDTGTYSVLVTDSAGCLARDTVKVGLNCNTKLVIPNAFSPNGDGKNDVFIPLYIDVPVKYTMHIYNRWGEKVFESNNIAVGWDGNFKGKGQPSGTYLYYIQYTYFGEKQKGVEGALELLR